MTIEQLMKQLLQTNAGPLKDRQITVEVDCDSHGEAVTSDEQLLNALSLILQYASECSPVGSRLSLSTFSTSQGTEIEIADNSDLTADSAREGSFVIAKAGRDLHGAGVSMNLLNCPQGGVAYSIVLPKTARAAA